MTVLISLPSRCDNFPWKVVSSANANINKAQNDWNNARCHISKGQVEKEQR